MKASPASRAHRGPELGSERRTVSRRKSKRGKPQLFSEVLGRLSPRTSHGPERSRGEAEVQPRAGPPSQTDRPAALAPGIRPGPEPRDEADAGTGDRRAAPVDALDPLARGLAQAVAPVTGALAAPPAGVPLAAAAPAYASELVARLVRRLSWGGSGRRGAARIEVDRGALAGARILVHTHGHDVSVELDAPPGLGTDAWCDRVTRRLEARGLRVIEVRTR